MYKESLPFHDKAVGVAQEHQEAFERWATEQGAQKADKIPELELEKTPQDEALIRYSEAAVRDYITKYGKDITGRPEVPLSRIHTLREGGVEEFSEGEKMTAAHSTKLQNILIDQNKSKVQFALHVFHELMHAYSYTAVQHSTDDTFEPYRAGFSIYTRDGEKSYFEDWDEGTIGLMTERFFKEFIENNSQFQKELRNRQEGFDLSREEEKKKLSLLIDDLYERNKEQFSDRAEVENLFINAVINGRLLPVARLVEKTYGKGSFRKFREE